MPIVYFRVISLLLTAVVVCQAQVTFTEYTVPTPASSPWGITAGPDGNLWFTENLGNKIGRITTAGVITEFPVPSFYFRPFEISAGSSDGNLWFTQIYTVNGFFRIARMTTAGEITGFFVPTFFNFADGITVGPDGNIWFTESHTYEIVRVNTLNNDDGIGFPVCARRTSGHRIDWHAAIRPATA